MWLPEKPARAPRLGPREAATRREAYLADLAEDLQPLARSNHPLVRWILPEERSTLLPDFLDSRSRHYAVLADGTVNSEDDISQELWEFENLYTIDARLMRLNADQRRVVDEYWRQALLPSLMSAGHPGTEIPEGEAAWSMAWYPTKPDEWSAERWAQFVSDHQPYPHSKALLGEHPVPGDFEHRGRRQGSEQQAEGP